MAKCVGSDSYCAPYELIFTNQALQFRDLKLPLQAQKFCQVSTEFQQCCVYSAADTMQQLARLQKHLKNQRCSLQKHLLYVKNKLRSYSGDLRLPVLSPPNAATVSLHYVSVHVCVCLCVCVLFLGKRGTLARRTIRGQR